MASENVKIINDQNFDETVSKGISLVDFWAEWCGPCRMQGPIVEELAAKVGGVNNICKLNVDEAPQTAGKYEVMSIPTILVFKDGEVVEKFVGLQDEKTLLNAVNAHV